MEWLSAVGGLGTLATGVIHAFDGTDKTVAQAQLTQAQTQQDMVAAQVQHDKLAAAANHEMLLYGLAAVGVIVAGLIAFKALG
ncbi:hypothetical protein E7T09_04485 [Deinococcus sp. KSM4-11]|uniref:hypothetical protein n=1 Tax=Deinococcus sp. KSM4-11 TaxID=2568654 RepID=UPI0010A5A0FD|nr:hypothetical protein [Deinococcus sp. KSM4-11]THF88468.1 hypothetical protein E7T09_04485 [Deinococcus sp. KSM4-11]